MTDRVFFDTNILLYLMSGDAAKADVAEGVIAAAAGSGVISVQVLSEFAAVAAGKLRMPWREIREFLAGVRAIVAIEPLRPETHDRALQMAERDRLSFYDASIIASALLADCSTLFSEDMQSGMVIDGKLKIRNPFGKTGSPVRPA